MALSAIRGAVNLVLAAFMPSYGQSMLEAGKKFDVKYNYGEEEAGVSCPSPATCHPSSSSSGSSRWFSPLKLREVFATDLRSIALWRVLVGLTIVGDLIDRGQYIYEHYTDYGVMPRYAVLENYWNEYYISPHLITGSLLGQRLIFLFHAICGLCLAVGFYSRTSAFLCWLMAYSIQVRNPFLLHGGDQYMRLLLFWSIFLPLGKCCSIDNALWYSKAAEEKGKPHRRYITRATAAALGLEEDKESEPVEDFTPPNSKLGAAMAAPPATSVPSSFRRPGFVLQQEQKRAGLSSLYSTSSGASRFSDVRNLILTAGSLAIVGQIVTMYVASVYHKSGRQWHEDGTSVYYALQLDYFRMPLGEFFLWIIGDPRNNPFLWWMTWIVVQWEFWGNVFFFSPIWTPACRMIACLGFMAMHLGFSMSLRLGTFFYITFSAPMVAFPSAFWDECVFTAPAHLYSSKDSEAEQSSAPSTVPSRASQKQRSIQAKLLDPSWLWSKFLDLLPFAHLCTPERVMTIVYDDSHPRLSNFIRCVSSLFLVPCHRLLPLSAYIPSNVTAEENDAPSSVASLVMVSNGKEYEDEEAVVQIFLRSPILWPIGWLLSQLLRAFPGRCRCPHWVFSRLLTPHTSKVDNEDRDADLSDGYDSASEQTSDSSAATSGAGGSGSNSTSPTKVSGAAFAYPRRGRNSRGKIRWRKVGWFVMQTVAVLLFTLVICWNMANFRKMDVSRVHWVGWLLGLDQAWGMFSPHPPLADWYHVIEARLEDNSTVDLIPDEGLFKWEGRPLTWEKPVPIYWSYMKSHRWQKVWENFNDDHEWYRLQVGRFICREYNKRHRGIAFGSPKLGDFTIWVIYNEQRLDNTRGPKEKVTLWRHMC